jgi:hypothetical protein
MGPRELKTTPESMDGVKMQWNWQMNII